MAKILLSKNLEKTQDSEDTFIEEDKNINNYKGVFYGEDTEQKYFEHGSHFLYKDICHRLEKLYNKVNQERRGATMYIDYSNDKKQYSKYNLSKYIYKF